MTDPKITNILQDFAYDGIYKREAVEAAITHREEIIPHLLQILKMVIADPEDYLADYEAFGHTYAAILLAYFKVPEAHDLIIKAFSFHEKIVCDLWADMVTEDLPILLLSTYNGSMEKIKTLILNKNAYEYSRISAMEALSFGVIKGFISREEALNFLGALFTGNEATPESSFWSFAAYTIANLHPAEFINVLEQAFKDDLVENFIISWQDIEAALQKSQEECLTQLKQELDQKEIHDVHEYMEWWACFQPQFKKPTFTSSKTKPKPPSTKKRKAKKKKKRKIAKTSKRKNKRR